MTENTMPKTKSSLEMAKVVWGAVQDQVKFADTKAGFVAAFHALLFGFMISNADKLAKVAAPDRHAVFYIATVLCAIYGVLTMLAVFLLISAVVSRFGELAPQSKTFFGHITRQHGKDYTKYCKTICEMSEQEWCEDVSAQIVEVSHIATTKHGLVRRAAQLTAMAFLIWCAALVVMLWVA